jgi:tRNA(Ile)-lysidine synthase
VLSGPLEAFSDEEIDSLFSPVAGARHIALAVSGGSDSMALLRLAARWAGKRRLTVLTVDHGLRPGSAEEAEQVCRWAAALGPPHVTLRWEGEKPSTGIQAKARKVRYRLMREWCEANAVSALLTAHTIDDQAETVIMRIARGTSIEGMAGIAPALSLSPSLVLHRPLLGVERARLRRKLTALGQAWIEDPSNEDDRFERVRVRRLMPALAEIGVSTESLALLASRALSAHRALCEATTQFLARFSQHHAEGYCTIVRADHDVLTEEAKVRVLVRQIGRYGGGSAPERNELELLSAALCLGRNTRRTLGGAIVATRTKHILIGREPGRVDPRSFPLVDGMVWDNRFIIRAARTEGLAVAPAALPVSRKIRKEIPDFVCRSLPAIFDGAQLVAIPSIGFGEPGFAAELRHARLLSDP